MERRFTFIIYVGGREYAAVYDQHIKTDEELQAMKFGIWAAASKFKSKVSVYVYRYRYGKNDWLVCDSMNAMISDDKVTRMSDGYAKLAATAKCGKVKL